MKKVARQKPKSRPYGLHLLLDGYKADSEKLADVSLLYETLSSLPDKIGMKRVGFPHIIRFTEPPIAGISGFIFIVESHISIHTYAQQQFISVDIYSCREFNANTAISFLKRTYVIKKMETSLVKRGTYFFENQGI